MAIVRLNTLDRDRKVNELLKSFGLPHVDYPTVYQVKPNPQLTGGSTPVTDARVHAVNELRKWIRLSVK